MENNDGKTDPQSDSPGPPSTAQTPCSAVQYDTGQEADGTNALPTLEPPVQNDLYHRTDWTNLPWTFRPRSQYDTSCQAEREKPSPAVPPRLPSVQDIMNTQGFHGSNHNPLNPTNSSTSRMPPLEHNTPAPEMASMALRNPISGGAQVPEVGLITPHRPSAQVSGFIPPPKEATTETQGARGFGTTNMELVSSSPNPSMQQKPSFPKPEQNLHGEMPSTSTREKIIQDIIEMESILERRYQRMRVAETESERTLLETSIEAEERALQELQGQLSRAVE